VRYERHSSEVPHGSGTFPTPTAWLSLQVSVLVSKPTVEDKSVSDIEVDTCVDGRGGFVEVVGVGRQFAHADLNVGGVGPDTGHAWTRRNSVALEPFVPNRIGTCGPDRTDPSHVKCNWDPRGSGMNGDTET
jgi:hypothetical protein